MTSLRARITLVTVLVAVVAVVVTGLVSLGLIRAATVQEAREQLAGQATAFAAAPTLAEGLVPAGVSVALVGDGAVTGAGAEYVNARMRERLASGQSVSATRPGPSGMAMVEGRPAGAGGAIVLVRPLATVDAAVGRATNRILLALAIGIGIAIAGGFALARMLAEPLIRAAGAAARLASGERRVPMPETATTEVAEVTRALAALDVALVTSESRQRDFLTSISHEIRTPLTAIRGYGEALADGMVLDVPTVGRTLVGESARLDAFLGDLLELSRLEAEDFSIQPTPVDVDAVLRDVVDAWAGRATTLDVTLRLTGAFGSLTTDPRRFRQVVDGLVENALRSTPAGGSVEVRAARGQLQVLDDGPGLAPEDLPVVFERGVLRERYRDARPVGTGLGLSIAARLTRRLGGTLSVANRDGGGAAFTVSFPLTAPGAATPR